MSMLLTGRNGSEFELRLDFRDSLPEVQDGSGDSSWATVTWRAATNNEEWEEQAPCLNLFEFQTLADWLEAAGRSGRTTQNPEPGEVELLAPELKFSVSEQTPDGVTIHIGFHLDDRPEEMNVDADTDEATSMDLFVTRESLTYAARSLRESIAEIEAANLKDNIDGDDVGGILGEPDDDLNIIDSITDKPPGAGHGEDNAGNR